MAARFVPNDIKTSIVKVNSYFNKTMRGTIRNLYFEGDKSFDNFLQFLFTMEELLNSIDFPRANAQPRKFTGAGSQPAVTLKPAPAASVGRGILATFKIGVLFRQNSSWQGTVSWLEKETEAQFRSVLELAALLDDVLSGEQLERENQKLYGQI